MKTIVYISILLIASGCAGLTARNHKIKGDRAFGEAKYDLALSHYGKTLEYDSKDRDARRNMASIYSIQKKYEQATALFTHLISENPKDMPSRLGLAYIYFLSNYVKAEKEYLEILKLEPRNYGVKEQLGWVYYYQKNYVKSKQFFQELQDAYSRNVSAQIALGWIAMTESRWKDAYTQFSSLKKDYPDNAEAKKALTSILVHYKP